MSDVFDPQLTRELVLAFGKKLRSRLTGVLKANFFIFSLLILLSQHIPNLLANDDYL